MPERRPEDEREAPRTRCRPPVKPGKTGLIINFVLKIAPVFFNKVIRVRYLEASLRLERTGVPFALCRGRNRSIRGLTGGSPPDADFVAFDGVFGHHILLY